MIDFAKYRSVCERIGKMYSDLETLEAQRAELERQMNNGAMPESPASAPVGGPPLIKRQYAHGVNKDAIPNTLAFLERHFIANRVCTPIMLMQADGKCSEAAAYNRLYKISFKGQIGPYKVKWMNNPSRLEKVEG